MLFEIPKFSIAVGTLGPAAIFLGLMYLCYRAESLHHIRLRLIRLFVSRRDLTHDAINQHILDESSLFAFRFSTGIKAQTAAEAERIIAFGLAHDVPLSLISRAGKAFNIAELKMREKSLPRPWHAPVFFALAFALFTPAVFFVGMSTDKEFMTSLTETGTEIWLSADHVTPREGIRKGNPTIYKDALCKDATRPGNDGTSSWPSSRDREILCEVFNDPELSSLIDEEVKAQRLVWIYCAVLLGGLSASVFFALIQILSAQNLARRLSGTAATSQQAVVARPRKLCIHLSIFGHSRSSDH